VQGLSPVISLAAARTDVLDELAGYIQATDISPTYATEYGALYRIGSDDADDDDGGRSRRAVSTTVLGLGLPMRNSSTPTAPFRLYSYVLLHEKQPGHKSTPPDYCASSAHVAPRLTPGHS